MNDYAKKYHENRRIERENAYMDELEKSAEPLLWTMYWVVAAVVATVILQAYQQHCDIVAQNDILVQCLNGKAIALGDAPARGTPSDARPRSGLDAAVLRCNITEYPLVKGVHHG